MCGRGTKFRGPWKKLNPTLVEMYTEYYKQKILRKTGDVWDTEQLHYVAKACAMYYLWTRQDPIINEMRHGVYLAGIGGCIFVLYKPIPYKGPFTRGYRYIVVDVPAGTYRIIKIRRKRK